ncbi:MAG: SDR family oxidoreductase [Candidatus Levybacteria bacterium]|nr:SDR family oxidoreductase [Candidatus Levybacteria bacterium]
MKILGMGLRGLVGSRIVERLQDKYEFESSGVDITNKDASAQIKDSNAAIVLHLAAKTDVDGCEKDKPLGSEGEAWRVNVEGTRNIADACRETNKKLIYFSTDFVFDGTKDFYVEDDTPNPVNWYARTKYEGEKIVQSLSTSWLIIRIAYPYRANFKKLDFFRAILKRLQKGEKVNAVTDHIFTPTFIDDIVVALDNLIENNSTGIFHVVGSQALTPFEVASIICKTFGYDQSLIVRTTRSEFFKNRATRSFQLHLRNDKIARLGVKMKTFEEGIKEIKRQMENSEFKITNTK